MHKELILGRVVATPGVLQVLGEMGISPLELVTMHATGNWGQVSEADWQANERALQDGSRIFSAYEIQGQKIWIITEADRSSTCILLPNEY